MQTLVIMALKNESQGLFEEAGFKPLYCGVGATAASYHTSLWINQFKPKKVINIGTAGSHCFNKGQLVECINFIQREPFQLIINETDTHNIYNNMSNSDQPILFKKKEFQTKPISQLPTAICGSADWVQQGLPIGISEVYDMEAYSMAYVCDKLKTPFHSFKYITDQADNNLFIDWKLNLKQSAQSLLDLLIQIERQSK